MPNGCKPKVYPKTYRWCHPLNMATLTIKKLPAHLHERLKEQARRNRRSLNNEVIVLLEQALIAPFLEETDSLIQDIEAFNARSGRTLDSRVVTSAKREGRR